MTASKSTLSFPKRVFIARHGETVFNAARRVQGDSLHTPLTRRGFAQVDAMGAAMAAYLEQSWPLAANTQLIASDTGRALQSLAVVAEHIGLDWHQAQVHPRLGEIGMGVWSGRYYAALERPVDEILDPADGLFLTVPDGGESMADLERRLRGWIEDQCFGTDLIIISHGITSRVLRALLTGAPPHPKHHVPVAPSLAPRQHGRHPRAQRISGTGRRRRGGVGVMRWRILSAVALALSAPVLAADSIGLFHHWGAFRGEGGQCHAMALAEPEEDKVRRDGYLSVVLSQKSLPQVYARLSREKSPNAAISLTVEGRRFRLSGTGRDAFARDAQMDKGADRRDPVGPCLVH